MKYYLFIPLLLLFTFACDDDSAVKDQAQEAVLRQESQKKQAINDIKSQILEEEDFEGRLWKGLATLQDNYNLSAPQMPTLGKVVIDLVGQKELLIQNTLNGDVYETRVDLKKLQSSERGFRLKADENPGEFPALIIRTIDDEPVIYEYKNGTLQNKNNELTIYLKDRVAIEEITPALLQTLRIVNEMN